MPDQIIWIIGIATLIGAGITVFLFIQAFKDWWAVRRSDQNGAIRILVVGDVIEEAISLVSLLLALGAILDVLLVPRPRPLAHQIFISVSLTLIILGLSIGSINRWRRRNKLAGNVR